MKFKRLDVCNYSIVFKLFYYFKALNTFFFLIPRERSHGEQLLKGRSSFGARGGHIIVVKSAALQYM